MHSTIESIHESAVEWVEDGSCSLAARLIAGRLFPEGWDVEGWPFFSCGGLYLFSFGVEDRKYQGQRVQEGEDRVLIRQLAAVCSISIRE